MQTVNFTPATDFQSEQAEIERRRKYAELLRGQADEALPGGQMVSGIYVPTHPFQHLAKALKGVNAQKGLQLADAESKALGQRYTTERGQALSSALMAGRGAPATSETIVDEQANGGEGQVAQINAPAIQGSRAAMAAALAGSKFPDLQAAGLAQTLKENEPYNLREGEKRFGPGNQVVASNDKSHPLHFADLGNGIQPMDSRTGARVGVVAPKAAAPKEDELERVLAAAGIDPKSPEAQALFKQRATKLATHQQPNMQNVTVNTEKQLFGNIAEGVGKDVATATQNAKAAVSTLNTVGQIREALDSGKVIAGPGTTARVFLGQVGQVLGVAGKDATETLTKTRTAIQSMAQLELDAAQQMKGQGQITEAERGIIRRAASGDIDSMTVPELRVLTDTLDKTARFKIKANAANVAKVKTNPASASLADFMDVPEPPAYVPKRRASDKTNPVDEALKKYGG